MVLAQKAGAEEGMEWLKVVMASRDVGEYLEESYRFLKRHGVDEDVANYTIRIMGRFLAKASTAPREDDAFCVAALYIASRHPFAYPNGIPRKVLSKKFRIKLSSISWYVGLIVRELGIVRLYDKQNRPYFIDPEDVLGKIVLSTAKMFFEEAIIGHIVGGVAVDVEFLANQVAEVLVDQLKVIPKVFGGGIKKFLEKTLKKWMGDLETQSRLTF